MEDEVLKEKNEQKRKELLKEARVRDYIKSSPLFQNLFNLPVRVSLEAIVEKYTLADAHNMSGEITEEILSGIHKSIVDEITNEPNGVVLNPDGSMNMEASAIEEQRLLEEEKATALYSKDDKNQQMIDEIFTFKSDKEDRSIESENFIKKIETKMPGSGIEENSKSDPEKFNMKTPVTAAMDYLSLSNRTPEAQAVIQNVIGMNAILIGEVKHHGFTAEMYQKLDFEEKYLLKRNLLLELATSKQSKDVLETLRTIIPGYKDIPVKAILTDLYSQLGKDDNVRKILNDEEPIREDDGLGKYDSVRTYNFLQKAKHRDLLYDKNGAFVFQNMKEVLGDNYVEEITEMYKKNMFERIVFTNKERFESNKTKILGLYKMLLTAEAEKRDPERKDDPEFWKEIPHEKGSSLAIIEEIIKTNPTLFPEYMDGRINVDFTKLKDLEFDKSIKSYTQAINTIMSNAEKTNETYPAKREELLTRMKNIDNNPDKAAEVEAIRKELLDIPRELIFADLYQTKELAEYAKKYDDGLFDEFEGKYNIIMGYLLENKKALLDAQKNRLAELKEVTKNEYESEFASESFMEDVRSGVVDEKIERQQEIEAQIGALRVQETKIQNRENGFSNRMAMRNIKRPTIEQVKALQKNLEGKKFRKVTKKIYGVNDKKRSMKGISGVIPFSKYMAKPKMIVDEIEIPIHEDTNPEKTSSTFETLLKEQGLAAKFKSVNGELTTKEYSDKMGEILLAINEKIKDGSLPKEIKVNGEIKNTTLKDIVKMSFENTEILLENLPEDISNISKDELSNLIDEHLHERAIEITKRNIEQKRQKAIEEVFPNRNIENDQESTVQSENEVDGQEKAQEPVQEQSKEQEPETIQEQEKEPAQKEREVVEPEVKDEEEMESNEPSQDELQARLMQQQRVAEEEAKEKAKEEVKEVVEEAKIESTAEVKEEKPETAIVKDTFFNRVKRGFLNNKVVKKFTELFGKKEENAMVDSAIVSSSNNSKSVTKDEDHWGVIEDKNAAARKALEEHEANKQKEAEKVKVGVVERKEEDFEIGDE